MGLQDFQLGSLSAALGHVHRGPPGGIGGLPEPWTLGPSPLAALPGFLAHPQAAYASYLTSPTGTSATGSAAAAAALSSLPGFCPPPVVPATTAGIKPPLFSSPLTAASSPLTTTSAAAVATPASPATSSAGSGGGCSGGDISPGVECASSEQQLTPSAIDAAVTSSSSFNYGSDLRLGSIESLRLRAKEQLEQLRETGSFKNN